MLREDFVVQSSVRRILIRSNIDYPELTNPNYLFARINLGVLYEEQKKWNEAGRDYRKVLQVTPDNEDVRRRLERIS